MRNVSRYLAHRLEQVRRTTSHIGRHVSFSHDQQYRGASGRRGRHRPGHASCTMHAARAQTLVARVVQTRGRAALNTKKDPLRTPMKTIRLIGVGSLALCMFACSSSPSTGGFGGSEQSSGGGTTSSGGASGSGGNGSSGGSTASSGGTASGGGSSS